MGLNIEKKPKNIVEYYIDGTAALYTYEMDERLERAYKPEQVLLAKRVEKILDKCLVINDFTDLYMVLKKTIQNRAKSLERKWINARITQSDFESAFWEEAYNLFKGYYYYTNPDYLYYQTLMLAIDRRAKDLQRKATKTKSGLVNNMALSLGKEFVENICDNNCSDIEKKITDKLFVKEILNDDALTSEEKSLLKVMYAFPQASLRELARLTGYKHQEQVRRLMERIKQKLAKYKEDYINDIKCNQPYGMAKRRG